MDHFHPKIEIHIVGPFWLRFQMPLGHFWASKKKKSLHLKVVVLSIQIKLKIIFKGVAAFTKTLSHPSQLACIVGT